MLWPQLQGGCSIQGCCGRRRSVADTGFGGGGTSKEQELVWWSLFWFPAAGTYLESIFSSRA